MFFTSSFEQADLVFFFKRTLTYQPMVVVVDLGPGGLDSWDSLMKKKYVT